MSGDYREIQPEDDATPELAVSGHIRNKIQEHRRAQDLEAEAHVRQLISLADSAIAGTAEVVPERVLMELHYALRLDERISQVLHPATEELPPKHKVAFLQHARTRKRGVHPPVLQEFQTAVAVAQALDYFQSYRDRTRYAPVRFAPIQGSAVSSAEEVTPIARRRVGAADTAELEHRAVNIDHSSCEHFLCIALPRKGKDSTACRIIGNLVDEHRYKAFSIFDDGRHETNMWGIPADEPQIRQILEKDFAQEPQAYPTKIYVPATEGVPDELPANFERFTVGLESLTPELLMQLASVTAKSADTQRRLGIAIRDTLEQEGTVEALIQRIHDYSEETEAQITVTEVLDDEQREERKTSQETVSYVMSEDKVLREIAKSLTMLAGDGLLGDLHQETNLDMVSEFQEQQRVAVLNCNYLEPHNRYLKYVLSNVWLNLIFNLRDDDELRLPRAVVELRELKDIAPSVKSRAEFTQIVSALTSTLHKVATRGGSRRMLMVGSTQKLNGVNKAIRQNMPNKILLQCGEEEVQLLDKSLHFTDEQERQLRTFRQGWGMLIHEGQPHYPLQFCPALNGMGLGDLNWKDRYGRAMGARVPALSPLPEDAERWYDMSGEEHPPEELEEGEWYLLPEDLRTEEGEVLSVQEALERRREYELPQEIPMRDTGGNQTQRTITLMRADDAKERDRQEALREHNIPPALMEWLRCSERKRENMMECLRAIDTEWVSTSKDAAQHAGVAPSTFSNYCSRQADLGACVEGTGRNETIRLTSLGVRALEIPWSEIEVS